MALSVITHTYRGYNSIYNWFGGPPCKNLKSVQSYNIMTMAVPDDDDEEEEEETSTMKLILHIYNYTHTLNLKKSPYNISIWKTIAFTVAA